MKEILEQNILAINQLKLNLNAVELGEFLQTRQVSLILSDETPAHMAALRTATDLLARLSFQVNVSARTSSLDRQTRKLVESARSFGFDNISQRRPPNPDLIVAIGIESASESSLQAYASGWNIGITSLPGKSDHVQASNPICGAMLGILIASEAFNRMVGPLLGKHDFPSEILVSLLDYSSTVSEEPAELTDLLIPQATLIGCGAVGGAFVYALSLLPSVSGELEIVDPDWFTRTNLHRYLLAMPDDVVDNRVYKTQRARDVLRHHRALNVSEYRKNFSEFLDEDCDERRIPFLISAVDSHGKRRDLGRETPQEALNASTGNFTLALSTHYQAYRDQGPCLGCHYPASDAEQEHFAMIAREIGLQIGEVQMLSNANARMTSDLLASIAVFRGQPPHSYSEFAGQPFDSFYQHGICGGIEVETPSGHAEIPLAHVSAAAGILLANEVVKRFSPELERYALDNFLQLDLLNLTSCWFSERRPSRPGCDCQKQIYRRRFGQKYEAWPAAPLTSTTRSSGVQTVI
ncbi:MAG TPA: ThiF family adenylyltransferase [Pyrinomonadaceae bacterium]|nr:ThiF family adenylyltransferase [Pyrinomonadaceae bacterium]